MSMLSKQLTRREALGLAVVMGAGGLLMAGCGSGAAIGSGGRAMPVELAISWPARGESRYIPAYASSIVLALFPRESNSSVQTLVVNRPSDGPATQTVRFANLLPPGEYVLLGNAFVKEGGGGALVATATSSVTVVSGEIARASLTLKSTITSLTLSYFDIETDLYGQRDLVVAEGFSKTVVTVEAKNADNATVVLPVDCLRFDTGNSAITLDQRPFGSFGIRLSFAGTGVGTLSVTEVNAKITSNVIGLRVEPLNSPNLLWMLLDAPGSTPGGLVLFDRASVRAFYQGEIFSFNGTKRTGMKLRDLAWGRDSDGNPVMFGLDSSGNLGELRHSNLTTASELTNAYGANKLGLDLVPAKSLANASSAVGLDIGPDGAIYVLRTRAIDVYPSLSEGLSDTYTLPSDFTAAGDVCIDTVGNLYASSTRGRSVRKIAAGSRTVSGLTQVSDTFAGLAIAGGRLIAVKSTAASLPCNLFEIDTNSGAVTNIWNGPRWNVPGASGGLR
jgi:hypothetical protein